MLIVYNGWVKFLSCVVVLLKCVVVEIGMCIWFLLLEKCGSNGWSSDSVVWIRLDCVWSGLLENLGKGGIVNGI